MNTSVSDEHAVTNLEQLIMDTVTILYSNGCSTRGVIRAMKRLNELFDTHYSITVTWKTISLLDARGRTLLTRTVSLSAINESRVAALTRLLYREDPTTESEIRAICDRASSIPPSPTWLFALAAGSGAVLLSLIFGLQHVHSGVLIFIAAGLGGLARRGLAKLHVDLTVQVLAAALIGGLIGGFSVHVGWTSEARLIAVCPGMVLVPGPQVINGCLDIADRRHTLGLSRLADAGLTIFTIAIGIAVGMALWGTSIPVTASFRDVPLWVDVAGAALVACCYPIYFSMPYRSIPFAFVAGGLGHAVHWLTITEWGWSAWTATLLCCFVVSLIIGPVSFHLHIPFSGAGFASVVALVPGVYFFRAISGLLAFPDLKGAAAQAQLIAISQDLTTACLIVLGIAIELIGPLRIYEKLTPSLPRGEIG